MRAWRAIHGTHQTIVFEGANGAAYLQRLVGSAPRHILDRLPQANPVGAIKKAQPELVPYRFVECELGYGQRFARIWRGESEPAHVEQLSLLVHSTSTIFEWANDILRVVHPAGGNMSAFGIEVRQLLLAACSEVENSWRAILVANQTVLPRNPSTKEYVRLLRPLRLNEWSVVLPRALGAGRIAPFKRWSAKKPTRSLFWYDAYNQCKHDMEGHLHDATVWVMINAVAAVYVMLAAQFGAEHIARPVFGVLDFAPVTKPEWSPRERCGPTPYWQLIHDSWKQMSQPEWTHVHFRF